VLLSDINIKTTLKGKVCGSLYWLRHCAMNRRVVGSIPDGVIGIFHSLNLYGHIAIVSTQPLTEKCNRDVSWGYWWPVGRADCLDIWQPQHSVVLKGLSRLLLGLLYHLLKKGYFMFYLKAQLELNTSSSIILLSSPE